MGTEARTWSFEDGKQELFDYIEAQVPRDARVLDVGPGNGGYGRRLRELGYLHIDAVEIFEPYVEEHGLREVYDNVHVGDIREYSPPAQYDLAILGDVLEHLDVVGARRVLVRLTLAARIVVVSVPWQMPQGPVGGNEHETHLQDDLSPQVVSDRFPSLQPLYIGERIGVYYTGLTDLPAPARPKNRPLRIAHFAPFAPRAAGLYEAARDFVRSDIAAGHVAAFVDIGLPVDGKRLPPVQSAVDERRGFTLRPTPIEDVLGYDLFVYHDAVDEATVKASAAPAVFVVHGQPVDCFKPELYKRGPGSYSVFADLAAQPRIKSLVSLWPEFVPFWEPIIPAEKLRCVDAPVVDQKHFRPDGPVHEIPEKYRGDFNILIASSWREVDPYEMVHGVFQAAERVPGLKLHIYAVEQPLGPWDHLFAHMRTLGIKGEVWDRAPDMDQVYRSMDLIVNPHRIATRIVMEGLSCGTPLVAAHGCRWTPFTGAANDPVAVGDAIFAAHERIKAEGRGLCGQVAVAAEAFSQEQHQERMRPIYEEALAAR